MIQKREAVRHLHPGLPGRIAEAGDSHIDFSSHSLSISRIQQELGIDKGERNRNTATEVYQSAGLQLPLEGSRFNDLLRKSVKTYEDLVKARNENSSMYQMADGRNTLVAYHNITPIAPERALDFGGFPMPSLAVMFQSTHPRGVRRQ